MINIALFGFGRIGQMHAENLCINKEIKPGTAYTIVSQCINSTTKAHVIKGKSICKPGIFSKNCFNFSLYIHFPFCFFHTHYFSYNLHQVH